MDLQYFISNDLIARWLNTLKPGGFSEKNILTTKGYLKFDNHKYALMPYGLLCGLPCERLKFPTLPSIKRSVSQCL